ncbi:TetR/AcrR family transcriptional regulator [Amycolatopsis thermoflava]|uniref:TetR family transcriptional regulator n=1 Tax=Amycolatopsis thermoflava TaxID=84480 RepID=A0A3N2H345_9PSEU|nr:TetR/AcrR family transcriptional regulator [Amycolatopsis thermoflava]ROS43338.1 TetR family transcriptional regulator [Amycolatopsis thermoflava]
MGRWPGGTQQRLQEAAIKLFSESGYDSTTVADIAGTAGVTERTFYNHFADKRDVLFPDQQQFIAEVAEAVTAAPPGQPPLDTILAALRHTADWFDQHRDAAQRRRKILDTRAELRERELAKMAALDTAIAAALRERGCPTGTATLTAVAAVAAYRLAVDTWLTDPEHRSLRQHLNWSFEELRAAAKNW